MEIAIGFIGFIIGFIAAVVTLAYLSTKDDDPEDYMPEVRVVTLYQVLTLMGWRTVSEEEWHNSEKKHKRIIKDKVWHI